MKKLVNVQEVEGEGLLGLLGENVLLFCMNYIYTGKLIGVNDTEVMLENAGIAFDVGNIGSDEFAEMERFKRPHYVRLSSIESYGKTDKS
jgi:hypothetical protein